MNPVKRHDSVRVEDGFFVWFGMQSPETGTGAVRMTEIYETVTGGVEA